MTNGKRYHWWQGKRMNPSNDSISIETKIRLSAGADEESVFEFADLISVWLAKIQDFNFSNLLS